RARCDDCVLSVHGICARFAKAGILNYASVTCQRSRFQVVAALRPAYCKSNMNKTYRPAFDVLERRDVPSAATPSTANLTAGVLTVVGSANADAINVTLTSGIVRVVDSGRLIGAFGYASIGRIVVDAGFGNDTVNIGAAITKPAFLYGGYGNDAL